MVQLPRLSFPPFSPRLQQRQGKIYIYDPVRCGYVRLQPEEWVRQSLLHYLIHYLGYPQSLMAVECMVRVTGMPQRADLLSYRPTGEPFLLVECKAPEVKLDTDTVAQVGRYLSVESASYMAITNGLRSYVFDMRGGEAVVCAGFPRYER